MFAFLHKPHSYMRVTIRALPWLGVFSLLVFAIGLRLALIDSPPDYQHGESVRIMYIHVPAAWMALAGYVWLAGAGGMILLRGGLVMGALARAAAPIGTIFTIIALMTGSIWGRIAWGAWWVWDARLTSVVILLFFYIGHIALTRAFDNPHRGDRAAGLLALVGLINLPIVKFSVDWWHSLHQGASVFRLDGPTIHPLMLIPLLVMAIAAASYFLLLLALRSSTELLLGRAQAAASVLEGPTTTSLVVTKAGSSLTSGTTPST